MGTFNASLRAVGDVQSIPATVEVDNGNISIAAGSTDIGSWSLSDVHLEQIPTGYRMAAEGDQVLIEMENVDAFAEAIQTKKSRFKREKTAKSEHKQETASSVDVIDQVEESKAQKKESKKAKPPRSKKPKRTKPAKAPKQKGKSQGLLGRVDGFLGTANRRFGAYLPSWVFTRAILGLGLVALLLTFIFPTTMSLVLVACGVLVILYGAVTYSDPMLASRWLPGRTQPPHVLMTGLGVLFTGILVGLLPY